MKCPKCYKDINEGSKFCRYCGTKIEMQPAKAKCPQCGSLNRAEATFCDRCGAKIALTETPKTNPNPKNTNPKEFKPNKTAEDKKTTKIENKSPKTTKTKTDSDNKKDTKIISYVLIGFFILLIFVIIISNSSTPPIEISSVKLVDTYKVSIDTSDGNNYYDDEMLVKEYKIKIKALKDIDNFILTTDDIVVWDNDYNTIYGIYLLNTTKNKQGRKYYNYQYEYSFKPKDLKEGETYKYKLKVCTYPQETSSKDNWNLHQLRFKTYDNDEYFAPITFDNIK